jgi:hypothetical protein
MVVRDAFSLFGLRVQNAGGGLFIDVLFGSLREPTGELLITDGLRGFQ